MPYDNDSGFARAVASNSPRFFIGLSFDTTIASGE
jgi:hypothetical protein